MDDFGFTKRFFNIAKGYGCHRSVFLIKCVAKNVNIQYSIFKKVFLALNCTCS
jgi:hypothetical protein